MRENQPYFRNKLKSEKKIRALSVQFFSSWENFGKICFFPSVVSTSFWGKICQMFHLTKIEKQHCLQPSLKKLKVPVSVLATGNEHPPTHHPLDAHYYPVLDDHYY
jgi:hypothetical protein